MAAPNIVNVSNITGVTTFVSNINVAASGVSVIVSNAASSNQVYKLNSLMASNTTGSTANITVKIFNAAAGAGSSVSIATTVTVPTASTLAVIGKDTPLYIEENRSIGAIAGTASAIDIVASYEVIS
jgi:mevalonate kinase